VAPRDEGGPAGTRDLAEAIRASVKEVTRSLKESRHEADELAREAIARVENALVNGLAGETMRGLPDLGDRVFGLRVDVDGSVFAALAPGRPSLVLGAKGQLILATRVGQIGTSVFVQKPPRSLIVASVFEPYMRAVVRAIEIHVAKAGVRCAEFSRISGLAKRITALDM
jgi:hypothetical protein